MRGLNTNRICSIYFHNFEFEMILPLDCVAGFVLVICIIHYISWVDKHEYSSLYMTIPRVS